VAFQDAQCRADRVGQAQVGAFLLAVSGPPVRNVDDGETQASGLFIERNKGCTIEEVMQVYRRAVVTVC